MRDIVLAIEKEKEYLSDKLSTGDSSLDVHDYLIDAGYRNIDEFHFDKIQYLLKQQNLRMERIFIDNESLDTWVERVMRNEVFFASADTKDEAIGTVAICGSDFDDFELYEANNVLPIKFNYSRGVNITGINDFNFCICVPLSVGLDMDFILKKLLYFIYKKNPTAEINGNDILVDGKKVVGLTNIENPSMCVFIVHVSLTDYIDIIYRLCPPHSGKEPGFISNITKKEFEEEVQSWLM